VLIGAARKVALEVVGDLLEPRRSSLSGTPLATADRIAAATTRRPSLRRCTEFLARPSVPGANNR
jgi:hypothetical protein